MDHQLGSDVSLLLQLSMQAKESDDELTARNYYHADCDKMRKALRIINWEEVLSPLSAVEAWQVL